MSLVLANRNAGPWRAISEFLDAQHLASFGLRRLSAAESEARRKGPACGMGLPRIAHPVGNTGYTLDFPCSSLPLTSVSGNLSHG